MVGIQQRTTLAATPERVWSVLADVEGQAAWMADVAWIRPLGPEREVGARFAIRTKVLGVPATTDLIVVTAWAPPRRMAVDHVGMVKGRGEWLLSAVPEGTAFEWREELSMPPPVVGDLALRLYAPVQRWMLGRSMRNLRRLVERTGW